MTQAKLKKHTRQRVSGKTSSMELKADFWAEFGRDIMVDGHGLVVFTAPGRDKYTPLFSKWGYALANIRTLSDFKRILRRVRAYELDENNEKLGACLADPDVSEPEKTFIRRLLGLPDDAKPGRILPAHPKPSVVRGALPQLDVPDSPTAPSNVIHVNFGTTRR